MDFNEKLQQLRRSRGITQEELAEALYVSRTAISKWESGRGYPNIESLKCIAKFFSVTVDELLSTDEVLVIAEQDGIAKEKHTRDLIFGLLDVSALLFFFLQLFAQKATEVIYEVSLLSLTEISPYLRVAYFTLIFGIVVTGLLTLALQNCSVALWGKLKSGISLLLNIFCVLLFIISMQPYAAVLSFTFLTIKVLMLIKWR